MPGSGRCAQAERVSSGPFVDGDPCLLEHVGGCDDREQRSDRACEPRLDQVGPEERRADPLAEAVRADEQLADRAPKTRPRGASITSAGRSDSP